VLCIHGGGYTSLTFSLLAEELRATHRVVAFDMRGHGATTTGDDSDLSAETLCQDAVAVSQVRARVPSPPRGPPRPPGSSPGPRHGGPPYHAPLHPPPERAQRIMEPWLGSEAPTASVVVVGHSLGGAVAARAAATGGVPGLGGLFVLDVVEGTAVASLEHMDRVLAARPDSFPGPREAILWALETRMTRNPAAAAVSVPDMLLPAEGGRVVWRTPLAASQPHWEGWYAGLSDLFLSSPCPKVLILAGTDRLDRPLTIGQMQGKFQLVVAKSGHCVQEDVPGDVAGAVRAFVARYKVGQPLPAFLQRRG